MKKRGRNTRGLIYEKPPKLDEKNRSIGLKLFVGVEKPPKA